jgi:hypothetical protein
MAVAAAVLFSLGAGADDTMRCRNGRIIDVGMPAVDVSSRCGDPKSRTVEKIPVQARLPTGAVRQTGTTDVERWIYGRGQGLSDAMLTFQGGKLVRIDLLTEP